MADAPSTEIYQTPGLELGTIFNSFAQKATDDFAHLKSNFVVFGLTTGTVHIETRPDPLTPKDAEILTQLFGYFQQATPTDAAAKKIDAAAYRNNVTFTDNEGQVSAFSAVVFRSQGTDFRNLSSSADSYATEVRTILEHELAHIVAPGASPDSKFGEQFTENVADAFGFMRQLQRGEDIRRPLESAIWGRTAQFMLMGDADHFSTFALLGLKDLASRHDLSGLSPPETANAAFRTALLNVPDSDGMDKIAEIFRPVADACRDAGLKKACRVCAEIMQQDHGENSEIVFKLGKAFLDPVIDRRLDIISTKIDMDYLLEGGMKLKAEIWDGIVPQLKEREAELARQSAPAESAKAESLDDYRRAIAQEVRDMQILGKFDGRNGTIIPPEQEKNYRGFMEAGGEAYTRLRFAQEKGGMPGDTGYKAIESFFAKDPFAGMGPLMAQMIALGRLDALDSKAGLSGLNAEQAAALAQKICDPLRAPDEDFGLSKKSALANAMMRPTEENLDKLFNAIMPANPAAEVPLSEQAAFKAGRIVIAHHLASQGKEGAPVLLGEKWQDVQRKLDAVNAVLDERFLSGAEAREMLQGLKQNDKSPTLAASRFSGGEPGTPDQKDGAPKTAPVSLARPSGYKSRMLAV